MKTTLRIGAGAGYAGDRIPPALELAEKGQLDYLVFECLAERTIALAQLERSKDPAAGFDPMLVARMRAVLRRRAGEGAATNGLSGDALEVGEHVRQPDRIAVLAAVTAGSVTETDQSSATTDVNANSPGITACPFSANPPSGRPNGT